MVSFQLAQPHSEREPTIVWTPSATIDNLVVQRIYSDEDVWKNTIYPCLYCFYVYAVHAAGISQSSPCFLSTSFAPFWNDDDLQPSCSVLAHYIIAPISSLIKSNVVVNKITCDMRASNDSSCVASLWFLFHRWHKIRLYFKII